MCGGIGLKDTSKAHLMAFLLSLEGVSQEQADLMAQHLRVSEYKKGETLIAQGDLANKCYFILKGMVRKYAIDEDGVETTFDFLSEYDTAIVSYQEDQAQISPYTFTCLEPCTAIVGELDQVEADYNAMPAFRVLSRQIMEATLDKVHTTLATYIRMSLEERVQHILDMRPDLLTRVPQHQLASYLGMKPESLSRIKGRLTKK